MKKLFIVAGELSGDKIGAWYIDCLREKDENIEVHAVGGTFLENAGATIYERIEKLNVVGFVEILKHIRFLYNFLHSLANHIAFNNFDEVVVADFPGFNLRLIKKLKKLDPNLRITYLSPPQMWVWGAGRAKIIKKYCDDVVVLYPFEVEWFAERGVHARWIGYPFYKKLEPYFSVTKKDVKKIAFIPASRSVELEKLTPVFAQSIRKLKLAFPHIQIIVPLAESIKEEDMQRALRQAGLQNWGHDVVIVSGEKEKLKALSSCCLALTKPGTVTLELALLGVPAIVAYKTSWITYFIARILVKVNYMALPNLFSKSIVYQEFIQGDCRANKIGSALIDSYRQFLLNSKSSVSQQKRLAGIRKMLQ